MYTTYIEAVYVCMHIHACICFLRICLFPLNNCNTSIGSGLLGPFNNPVFIAIDLDPETECILPCSKKRCSRTSWTPCYRSHPSWDPSPKTLARTTRIPLRWTLTLLCPHKLRCTPMRAAPLRPRSVSTLNNHVTNLENEHEKLNLHMAQGEVSGFGSKNQWMPQPM